MEDNFLLKTTFDERRPLIEFNLQWQMTFDGNLQWKRTLDGEMTFDGRGPLIEENFRQKTTFDGQLLMEDNSQWKTIIDLQWQMTIKERQPLEGENRASKLEAS